MAASGGNSWKFMSFAVECVYVYVYVDMFVIDLLDFPIAGDLQFINSNNDRNKYLCCGWTACLRANIITTADN